MAFEQPGLKITLPAGADLSALQYTFVKLNSSGQAVACSATTDIPVGVLQNKPNASGVAAEIVVTGLTKIVTAAALNPGVQIATNGSGQAAAIVDGTDTTRFKVGQMVQGTAAASGIGTALVDCLAPRRAA